jgi:hypothetical protein
MRAHVGDKLISEGTRVREARRVGLILELRHEDGAPPYVVRWLDNGRESLVYPGPDARIQPAEGTPSR